MLQSCAHGGAAAAPLATPREQLPGGLEVRGTRFVKDGKPMFVSGFNYWAGTTLAREGNQAGWDQVRRDLDGLQAAGINMIRTTAATEGPDTEPFRIVPTIQPAMGQYDPAGVAGVLRFAEELKRRGVYGIFMLNNFWQWSGGFAQYLAWAGQGTIPYPPPHPGGSWDRFQKYAGSFYKNAAAKAGYDAFIRYLVPQLNKNPVVIWELANEPRGMTNISAYHAWIDDSARLIKSLAPGQLVTTGSEGQTASPTYAGMDVVKDHQSAAIDFICFHMWAMNWGWVKKETLEQNYPKALERAKKYVADHAAAAARVIDRQADLVRGVRLPARRRQLRSRVSDHAARQVFPGGLRAGAVAAADDADGGHHAMGVGGRRAAAASGRVLEAGRPVHRRSAARGAGLVQRL